MYKNASKTKLLVVCDETETIKSLANGFEVFGTLRAINFLKNKSDSKTRQAYVTFEEPEHAKKALEKFNGITLPNSKMPLKISTMDSLYYNPYADNKERKESKLDSIEIKIGTETELSCDKKEVKELNVNFSVPKKDAVTIQSKNEVTKESYVDFSNPNTASNLNCQNNNIESQIESDIVDYDIEILSHQLDSISSTNEHQEIISDRYVNLSNYDSKNEQNLTENFSESSVYISRSNYKLEEQSNLISCTNSLPIDASCIKREDEQNSDCEIVDVMKSEVQDLRTPYIQINSDVILKNEDLIAKLLNLKKNEVDNALNLNMQIEIAQLKMEIENLKKSQALNKSENNEINSDNNTCNKEIEKKNYEKDLSMSNETEVLIQSNLAYNHALKMKIDSNSGNFSNEKNKANILNLTEEREAVTQQRLSSKKFSDEEKKEEIKNLLNKNETTPDKKSHFSNSSRKKLFDTQTNSSKYSDENRLNRKRSHSSPDDQEILAKIKCSEVYEKPNKILLPIIKEVMGLVAKADKLSSKAENKDKQFVENLELDDLRNVLNSNSKTSNELKIKSDETKQQKIDKDFSPIKFNKLDDPKDKNKSQLNGDQSAEKNDDKIQRDKHDSRGRSNRESKSEKRDRKNYVSKSTFWDCKSRENRSCEPKDKKLINKGLFCILYDTIDSDYWQLVDDFGKYGFLDFIKIETNNQQNMVYIYIKYIYPENAKQAYYNLDRRYKLRWADLKKLPLVFDDVEDPNTIYHPLCGNRIQEKNSHLHKYCCEYQQNLALRNHNVNQYNDNCFSY